MTFLLWLYVCDQFSAMQNSLYTLVLDDSGHGLIFCRILLPTRSNGSIPWKKTNGTTFHPACGIIYHYTAWPHVWKREARCDKEKTLLSKRVEDGESCQEQLSVWGNKSLFEKNRLWCLDKKWCRCTLRAVSRSNAVLCIEDLLLAQLWEGTTAKMDWWQMQGNWW